MKKSSNKCDIFINHSLDKEPDEEYIKHLAECEYCRAADKLLNAVHKDIAPDGALPPLNDLSARKTVDAVLAKYKGEHSVKQNSSLKTPLFKLSTGLAAALLITLISWLFWPGNQPQINRGNTLTSTSFITGSGFALLSGQVFAGSSLANLNEPIPSSQTIKTTGGRAIINLPFGIAISMNNGTTLKVSETETGRLKVDLIFGTALFAVDPDTERPGFSVETDMGRVNVTGTVFAIEKLNSSETVYLLKGSLVIIEKNGTQRELENRQSLSFGQPGAEPLADNIKSQMFNRLDELWNLKLGGNLLPLLKTRVNHTASANSGYKNFSDNVALEVTDKNHKKSGSTLKILMKQARQNRVAGEIKAAVRIYEEIVKKYSSSNDARTSHVLLGQLYLNQLKQPENALKHFNAYLKFKKAGALTQEALYGKSNAFRNLNRRDAERSTLKTLLNKYPDGIFAESAQKRIEQLP